MVSVPGCAFAGMVSVSCIVTESRSGLEKRMESARTSGPVVFSPSDVILMAVLPLTVTTSDLPTTAELPEVGLTTLTSGGGRFPVARRSVSTPDEFPAPSMAVAVTNAGVPGGTALDANSVKGITMFVTALVKVVSKVNPTAPTTCTVTVLSPMLSLAPVVKAITVSACPPTAASEIVGGVRSLVASVEVESLHAATPNRDPATTASAMPRCAARVRSMNIRVTFSGWLVGSDSTMRRVSARRRR